MEKKSKGISPLNYNKNNPILEAALRALRSAEMQLDSLNFFQQLFSHDNNQPLADAAVHRWGMLAAAVADKYPESQEATDAVEKYADAVNKALEERSDFLTNQEESTDNNYCRIFNTALFIQTAAALQMVHPEITAAAETAAEEFTKQFTESSQKTVTYPEMEISLIRLSEAMNNSKYLETAEKMINQRKSAKTTNSVEHRIQFTEMLMNRNGHNAGLINQAMELTSPSRKSSYFCESKISSEYLPPKAFIPAALLVNKAEQMLHPVNKTTKLVKAIEKKTDIDGNFFRNRHNQPGAGRESDIHTERLNASALIKLALDHPEDSRLGDIAEWNFYNFVLQVSEPDFFNNVNFCYSKYELLSAFAEYLEASVSGAFLNHFIAGNTANDELTISTEYPYSRKMTIKVNKNYKEKELELRIPGWSCGYTLKIDGRITDTPELIPPGREENKHLFTKSRHLTVPDIEPGKTELELSLSATPYSIFFTEHKKPAQAAGVGPFLLAAESLPTKDNKKHQIPVIHPEYKIVDDFSGQKNFKVISQVIKQGERTEFKLLPLYRIPENNHRIFKFREEQPEI